MAIDRICAHCGRPESEHCSFVPLDIPEGCQCDVRTWGSEDIRIGPICDEFVGEDGKTCGNCEHDRECHNKVKP